MQFMKTFVRSIANTSVQVYNLCHFYALPLVMPKQFLSFGKFAFVFARIPILISQPFFLLQIFCSFIYRWPPFFVCNSCIVRQIKRIASDLICFHIEDT